MAASTELWLGPPGTGKTTALLRRVEQELAAGIPIERIGFLSFSRRAIFEALERTGYTREQAPNFRTIHSLGYHLCDLRPSQVVRPTHLYKFGQDIEEIFSTARIGDASNSMDEPVLTATSRHAAVSRGDRLLSLYTTSRARSIPIEQAWREVAPLQDINEKDVKRFEGQYNDWKERRDLYDFSDMIALAEGSLDVDVVIVDEAQDTTATQWRLLRNSVPASARVVIAGDDDQAIYAWAGADPGFLHRVLASTTVLPHSYRLPRRIKDVGDRISGRIGYRLPKVFTSRDAEGTVDFASDTHGVDLRSGNWLLLARTRAQLARWTKICRLQGVVYQYTHANTQERDHWSWLDEPVLAARTYHRLSSGRAVSKKEAQSLIPYIADPESLNARSAQWGPEVTWELVFGDAAEPVSWMVALPGLSVHDVEYIRELRRNHESLSKPGRIRISTIHHAKGSEADNVAILAGLTPRVQLGRTQDPDGEFRVQYVGATRAKDRLVIVGGGSRHQYQF